VLTRCWPRAGPVLAPCWPRASPVLAQYWPSTGPALAQYWPRASPLLALACQPARSAKHPAQYAQVWTFSRRCAVACRDSPGALSVAGKNASRPALRAVSRACCIFRGRAWLPIASPFGVQESHRMSAEDLSPAADLGREDPAKGASPPGSVKGALVALRSRRRGRSELAVPLRQRERRCSSRRGMISTKLQGRWRLSSCHLRMPFQASAQAPGEPGRQNM
jgi:hypothetical protein